MTEENAPEAKYAPWKTVILASLGGALEMYDFIIYGVFAMEIASQFFPASNPISSLLQTFAVFAIGYVSRPLGGIVLSSFGDRFGRRVVFLVSIFAMSSCTMAIGLIPGYDSIGVAAPILLILLRLGQGFFLAGELPCSITYVVEEMPERASFVSGLVIFCLTSGVFVATLVSVLLHSTLPAAEVGSYGWRIAFVLGGLLGLLSYWLRTSLEESNGYRQMKSHVAKHPFRSVITTYPRQVLVGIGVAGIVNTANSLLFVVLPSYLTGVLHYDAAATSTAQSVGIAASTVSILVVAWLGDRISTVILHRVGCLLMLVGAYPLYQALVDHQIGLLPAFVIVGIAGGFVSGTYAHLLASLFPTNVRFSGIALSLNLATVIFTAITPLAITQLTRSTGLVAAPGLYLSVVALLALLAGVLLHRLQSRAARAHRPVDGVPSAALQ